MGEFLRDRNTANRFTLPIKDIRILDKPITIGSGDTEETLTPSDDKVLFTFTLLHSYPAVNSNGVTFAYPLLKKSISTAVNSPIDKEHKIEGSPVYEGENIIIGSIISASLPELDNSDEIFPNESQPVTCVGILWRRITEANAIVADLEAGKEWKVSMEVTRNMDRDVFLAEDEIIYQSDIRWDAAFGAWIQQKDFEGKNIGLALGGTGLEDEDSANFFGAGVVGDAADENADIHDFSIVPMANKSSQPYLAFATHANKKETTMAKENKIVITSGGSHEETSMVINGNKIEGFDELYLSSDKDYGFYLNWSKQQEGRDGVAEWRSFSFDPSIAAIVENKKGGNSMKNPTEVIAKITEMLEAVEAKFKDFISPEKVDEMVATKLEVEKTEIESKYAKYTSPDDLDVKIAEAITKRDEDTVAYSTRETKITEASLELTDERKKSVRSFEISADGNDKFAQWLVTELASQTEMVESLEKKGIEVNDDVKKSIATMSGKDDPRFTSAVAMLTSVGIASEIRIPADAVSGNSIKSNEKYVH